MAIAKKKKRFFEVELPLISKTTQLLAFEPKELEGKTIKYDLTRILRGKSIIIRFRVKTENNKLTATPIETKILPYYLKRTVRKGTTYVEDSFSTKCKNAELRIKPFIVTRKKVSNAVRRALREKAKEELNQYIKDQEFQELFQDVLKNKIQKTLSLKLKKIYPLYACELRVLKVEKEIEPKKKENKKEEISEEK